MPDTGSTEPCQQIGQLVSAYLALENKRKFHAGQLMTFARKQVGMTQRAMADAMGITPVYLCQIERGVAVPTVEMLYRINKILSRRAHSPIGATNG